MRARFLAIPVLAILSLAACGGGDGTPADVSPDVPADVPADAPGDLGPADVPADVPADAPADAPADVAADEGPSIIDIPGTVEGGYLASLPCLDDPAAMEVPPDPLPAVNGTVLRCARMPDLVPEAIAARLARAGYDGPAPASGAHVYRVLYRTQRGNGAAGYSAALAYLPGTPKAATLPIVVASHGSRGQAPACAPSLDDQALSVHEDFERQVLPLVGAGFAVIAPDLAGYANQGALGNPPSAYASAADVAPSTLDGARALRELLVDHLTDDVVLTGHSQGGHTALSALALAPTYAPELVIKAVATWAPLWLSQRSWGALFLLAPQFPIAKSPAPNAVSVWYHYTHAELYDGVGEGRKLFQADLQDAIADFVDEACWESSYPALEVLAKQLTGLFTDEFQNAIVLAAALGQPCPAGEPAKSLCERWVARYVEDRPHLADDALHVPLLVMYGGEDGTITPDRFQCALDRLHGDGANLVECYDPAQGHGTMVAKYADYAVQWIANQTLGTPVTATCPQATIALKDDKGEDMVCATPPPND